MLSLVDGKEMSPNTLGKLRRVIGAGREPRIEEDTETPMPRLRVREVACIDKVRDEGRGELENFAERRVPRGMRTVGSIRGGYCELLGKESEQRRQGFGALGLRIALSRRRTVFGRSRLVQGPESGLGKGTNL